MTVSSIPARTYLTFVVNLLGAAGTIGAVVTFNSDSGSNYSFRTSTNGAADSASVTQTSISLTGAATYPVLNLSAFVVNLAAVEKNIYGIRIGNFSGTGAGTAPDRAELMAKWANTSAQISRIDVTNAGTGDYAIGSEVIVLGHN